MNLNWKEIALLSESLRPLVEGLFVDRIIVPERPRFPGGYLKGEWCLRLTGRRAEANLLISIRPRHPYVALAPGKGPRAAASATRSPFDLALSKWLRGQRLLTVDALPRERTLIFWFSTEEHSPRATRQGLVLSLIPAVPEAWLVLDESVPGTTGATAEPGYPILAWSRAKAEQRLGRLVPPDGSRAPENLAIREEIARDPERCFEEVEKELAAESFEVRLRAAQKELRSLLKHASDRIRQNETSVREAEKEPDWQKFGDLLKGSLHTLASGPASSREVHDYETGDTVSIPCDPKLSPTEQIDKFYSLARRRKRRFDEASTRLRDFRETSERLHKLLETEPASGDWAALERLERSANLSPTRPAAESAVQKKRGGWLGKAFVSRDGLPIWVGRSRDENLELTFKFARGNDLWLHVRGRPGAHALIPLQPGKSAPLETLLDAAVLTIYYSGGEKWGKTEVDYTFKKYVKRIKDSTEASYTHNKTLIIEPDPARLKRLLAGVAGENAK